MLYLIFTHYTKTIFPNDLIQKINYENEKNYVNRYM